jgi:hypothetical protein
MRKQIGYIAMIFVFAMVGCWTLKKQGTSVSERELEPNEPVVGFVTPDPQPTVPTQTETASLVPMYDVIESNKYDTPIKTQIVIHALVSGRITEVGLRSLLEKLYVEANAMQGFKYHGGKPTHVFIYLYTSRDHFKSNMGQWIAMLSKVGENSRIDTQVKTELIAQIYAKPEVKFDLIESKRKEIFIAIVTAEDRADKEAQHMYPIPDPLEPGYSREKVGTQWKLQIEAFEKLIKKYRMQVAQLYSITEEQLHEISIEGITKNWPIPPVQ